MSEINLGFSIVEDDSEITRLIMKDLADELTKGFKSVEKKIKKITGDLLRQSIIAQPEYGAITSGSLRYELGIVNPTARLLNIIDVLTQNIEVNTTPFSPEGETFKGGIAINAVKSDYSDIIHLRDSIVVTEKGVELEWLRWLLLEGRQVIISGWDVEFGPFGRTGGAHMILGGNWKVPSEYAGRVNDNFILRAVKEMQSPLKEQIQECIASI